MLPTVVVHGIGRCGSSLAMQMLHAGGWPVVGEFPDYEPERLSAFRHGAATSRREHRIPTCADDAGKAMKLVWPAVWPWGETPAVAVLASRDPLIQAESQVKLMRAMFPGGLIDGSKRSLRRLAEANADDAARARSLIRRAGVPLLEWPFAAVLHDPRGMALRLSSFLYEHAWRGIDPDKAAAMVITRSPKCFPGMIETMMIEACQRLGFPGRP